jgi:PAS domain S-box-containing protein
MITVTGYKIDHILYQNKRCSIVRAVQENDQQKVIIKTLSKNAMHPSEIKKFQREFEIGHMFNSPYIVKYLAYHPDTKSVAIIQEDDDSVTLEHIIPKEGFDIPIFLNLAIQLTQGLGDIHQKNVTHRDIKPANLIVKADLSQIKYTDFGNASLLREENQSIQSSNKLAGTLAYISPEQTGRMNRNIDYRTDFYSLGITFYQLLCGQLPFQNNDAMALIHCHLAKSPRPLTQIKANIPTVLANIINKLLMKNAEDRYQSVQGLLYDLQKCQWQFAQYNTITPFELGQQDFSEKMQISQKLYGREKEIEMILTTFHRASEQKPEVLLVAGYSGIGKSVLINEVQKPITLKNGRFLAGKFDQLSKSIAYSAIAQAFQGLVKQLLGENEKILAEWQEKLLSALGSNGQLVIDVIPEIERIIGKQPAIINLAPIEAKNRFNTVFQNFISVFTKKEHPLVLFLDDLQWADFASLELIKLFITHAETQYFLLIGAYRDNEVSEIHPAMIMLEDIKKMQVPVQLLSLVPLEITAVQQCIADSLNDSIEYIKPLSALVYQKTQGNPFFMKMYLRSLYDEKLLILSHNHHWQWDLDKIHQYVATDKVIDFMVSRIHQLEDSVQRILALASCLGHCFTLNLLEIATQKTSELLLQALQTIFNAGLAYPAEENIHFAHDRVQEAAYSLLPAQEKKSIHLLIGRQLVQKNLNKQYPDNIFEIVDHLNISIDLIENIGERTELAKLNLLASQKAKNAVAYVTGLTYIEAGLSCLDENTMWSMHYSLVFSLYHEKAELEHSASQFEQAEKTMRLLIDKAQSVMEKAGIYNLLIDQKTLLTENQPAIELAKTALALLGIDLPDAKDDLEQLSAQENADIIKILEHTHIKSVIELPEVSDPQQRATLKLLLSFIAPTFLSNRALYNVVIAKAVKLTLHYGHVSESPLSFVFYGNMLCEQPITAHLGYEFGLVAIKLCEYYKNLVQTCKVLHTFSILINPWFKSLESCQNMSNDSFQAGLDSGEMQYAGYTRYHLATLLFFQGQSLPDCLVELKKLVEILSKMKHQFALDVIHSVCEIVYSLLEQKNTVFPSSYADDIRQRSNVYALCHRAIFQEQLAYLYGNYEESYRYTLEAEILSPYISAHYALAVHKLYHSLNLSALYIKASEEEKSVYLAQLIKNQEILATWANNCSENFQTKYLLVSAEIARLQDNLWEAGKYYDQAIEAAQTHDHPPELAIANELAGKFWLTENRKTIAQVYLNNAYLGFQRWGAKQKLAQLKAQYSQLLTFGTNEIVDHNISLSGITSHTNSLMLDMQSVVKASQIISSDLELNKLLVNMMKIIIETAGAQKGSLLLNENGTLFIAAEYTNKGEIEILQNGPLKLWKGAHHIVEYVKNTGQIFLSDNAYEDKQFNVDPYINELQVKSLLCMPIIKQDELKGLLYVENNLVKQVFTQHRVTVLTILAGQMAISLENAKLFETSKKEIAERMQTEKVLRESENRFRTLVQATHVVTWIFNPKGAFVQPQQLWEQFTGQAWEQYSDFGWVKAIHPDDSKLLMQVWHEAVQTKMVYQHTARIWHQADQTYRYVMLRAAPLLNDKGEIHEWIGTGLDIHTLKATEAALRDVTQRLNLALSAAHIGTWSLDIVTDKILWDEQMFDLYGIDKHKFSSNYTSVIDLTHPDDRAFLTESVTDTMKNNKVFDVEYRILKPNDNTLVTIASRANVYRDEEGKVISMTGVCWDLTLRKKLEKERLEAVQQAKEQERQRAQEAEQYRLKLEEFIDTICHEMRNPLNGIYGGTTLLQDNIHSLELYFQELNEKSDPSIAAKLHHTFILAKEQLDIIYKCAEQQKVIVDDVLDLSKLENNKIELNPIPFNLKALFKTVLQMFTLQITQANLKVTLNLPEEINWLKADAHRLSQILVNLLSNAVKFTKEGSIEISVTSETFLDTQMLLHICVKDTGIGMTEEEKDRLFQRFSQANHQTSSKYGGSGLGLFISKKLVERMGGTIAVESKKFSGTQFSFSIQYQQVSKAEIDSLSVGTENETFYKPKVSSSKTILVVEDNVMNQRILKSYLEKDGYFCQIANNGLEALELYEHFNFSLIFMDIEMPKMGGLEATCLIREKEQQSLRPRIPIIGLSGNAQLAQIDKAKEIGMDDYITKPFHKKEISTIIDTYTAKQSLSLSASKSFEYKESVNLNKNISQEKSTYSQLIKNDVRKMAESTYALEAYPTTISAQSNDSLFSLKKRKIGFFVTDKLSEQEEKVNSKLKRLHELLVSYRSLSTADMDYMTAVETDIKTLDKHPCPLICLETHIAILENEINKISYKLTSP